MSEFTSERLAELKAVAEAATEGPWELVAGGEYMPATGLVVAPDDGGVSPRNAAHIAAFDPPTVLSLIAALEAANESKPSNSVTSGSANERELADLRAALEAKTAEVERRKRQARRAEAKLTQYVRSVPALTQERDAARRERDESRTYADYWKQECDSAQRVMNTHSCGENVEAAYRRTIEAERERDEARAEKWRKRSGQETLAWIDHMKRADKAEAALERVKALHRKGTVYSHEDSCTNSAEEHSEEHHRESANSYGEYYCEQMPEYDICIDCSEHADPDQEWPCPTIRALETGDDDATQP